MKPLQKLGAWAVLATGILAGPTAFAGLITGTIDFTGTGILNAPIPSATAFTALSNVKVAHGTQTGDYIGADGASVTAHAFAFLPTLSPNPVTVWSFVFAGKTYSFSLVAPLTVIKTVGPAMTVSGSGTASITGFTDTPGLFMLTTQGRRVELSFSSATNVAEGGATMAMLGAGLLCLGIMRRCMN